MPNVESYAKGPSEPALRDITIGQALAEVAGTYPDSPALIAGTPDPSARRQWTYADLHRQSLTVAAALLNRFEPGERVAVWAPNIPEWVILQYGCALAGIVLVTVNPSYQADEVAYVLGQSRAAGIFLAAQARGNQLLEHLEAVRDRCPELREVIRFDQWEVFLNDAGEATAELPEIKPMDACMIQYTSGTTGFPKGALLHHRGMLNNAIHVSNIKAGPEGGVQMGYLPLFHTGGCGLGVLGALSKHSTLVLVESFEPGLVLELMETYGAGDFSGVPTMMVALLEHPDFQRRDLSSIRQIGSGGSTVPAAMVQRLEATLDAPFTIVFGQTECSPVSSMTHTDDTIEDKAYTVGRPMPHVEVKIIDPETGATVPLNTVGEYCTRGYHVMLGYFDMPEATAAAIDEDGWLHFGDLCSMDERGYCKVEGRLKDMIIRGGENIYPREIEELLFRHPSVAEVAVIGLPSDRMGEEVAAFLRAEPGQQIDQPALFSYLREHLSPQKTPRLWFEVETFPLTGSGKIQKFMLRQQWEQGMYSEMR